jgi:hypothetical protein
LQTFRALGTLEANNIASEGKGKYPDQRRCGWNENYHL